MSEEQQIVYRSPGNHSQRKYHCTPDCEYLSEALTFRREVAEAWDTLVPCKACWSADGLETCRRCSACGKTIGVERYDVGECERCSERLLAGYVDE
jgi:hypothetical protein